MGRSEREREGQASMVCARDVTHRVANHRRKPSIASTTRNMRRTRPSSGSRVNRLGESSKVTRVVYSPPAKISRKIGRLSEERIVK